MSKSTEEIIRDRIARFTGKQFQQLVWDILICHYPNLQTPKMLQDLGSDGHDFKERTFYAVYAPESYNPSLTVKKITNQANKNDPGDYEKFAKEWLPTKQFDKWFFVTSENLTGKPLQLIASLNNNGDGIIKENIGLEKLVKLALDLKTDDINRIFNLDIPAQGSIATEVETIMDLICYISDNNELTKEGFKNSIPDPDKKLERFSDYCIQLKREIVNSWMYSTAQKEAENVIGLDKIMIGKIVGFLEEISLRFLGENGGDPMLALNKLTDYFEDALKKANKHYDHNAIRYYLIAEIPKCNVFPNDYE